MSRWDPAFDIDEVEAIDAHVHIDVDDSGHHALPDAITEASHAYFGSGIGSPSLDEVAEHYRERSLIAVVFTMNAETALGHRAISNDEIVDGAVRNADVLVPFASVDPLRQHDAIEQARRLAGERGVRGFKFHPSLQGFDPSDPGHRPLWAALEEIGLPVVFHTGQTGVGAGRRGAFGIRLRYSDPMLLDDVAADFPGIDVVLAHPSVPWQDEAISIATHKTNVWIDLSGWSPKYFPDALVRALNGPLRDRVLFGSDYPMISPDRWLRDFAALPVRDEVRPGILKDNAARLLGLSS